MPKSLNDVVVDVITVVTEMKTHIEELTKENHRLNDLLAQSQMRSAQTIEVPVDTVMEPTPTE